MYSATNFFELELFGLGFDTFIKRREIDDQLPSGGFRGDDELPEGGFRGEDELPEGGFRIDSDMEEQIEEFV